MQHKLIKLFTKDINYLAYIEGGRHTQVKYTGGRKPLSELSLNTTRKPHDSKEWERRGRALRAHFGCSIYKYRSIEIMTTRGLISSDLTLKIKLIY